MARHSLPAFPLLANIWHFPNAPGSPPDLSPKAELRVDTSVKQLVTSGAARQQCLSRSMYVPKGTDLRTSWFGGTSDVVELPAGSGRFYNILDVDDIAKGFPNEFRIAALTVANVAGGWTPPYP